MVFHQLLQLTRQALIFCEAKYSDVSIREKLLRILSKQQECGGPRPPLAVNQISRPE